MERRDGFSPGGYIGWERHLSNYWGAAILSYSWNWGHFFLLHKFLLFPNYDLTWSEVLAAQRCPTLCNSVDCSLPGSSVHGILQARILELGAILLSRGLSQPKDRIWVSRIAGRFFTLSHQESPFSTTAVFFFFLFKKKKTDLNIYLESTLCTKFLSSMKISKDGIRNRH